METRPDGADRRTERTLGTVRVLVAAALLAHAGFAVASAPAGAHPTAATVALVSAATYVLVAGALVVAARRRTTSAHTRRRFLVDGGAVADAVLLAATVAAVLVVEPAGTLAWGFLLWLPCTASARGTTRGSVAVTIAATLLVGAVAAVVAHVGAVDLAWSSTELPFLLVALAGGMATVISASHRRTIDDSRSALVREQDRTSQLQEADDLKNTFLAAVSHEIRTPLTSIMGFAMTLLDRQELGPDQRERMLRTLVVEAEHLEDILANLLDLDRLTRGKATLVPARVDIADVVTHAVEHVQRRTSREIRLELTRARVAIDPAKVERIVENLVGNAVKYTPEGEEIVVTVTSERCAAVRIRVDDSGPGIAPELRDTIFEPFKRGASQGVPGTGIGLSLVDRFSRMHGGSARVTERPGGGARFEVVLRELELPGAPEEHEQEQPLRAVAGGTGAGAQVAFADGSHD